MAERLTFIDRYYRWRSRYWHYKRLLFPSPAEVNFMQLMGAKTTAIRFIYIRHRQPSGIVKRWPLIIVWSLGKQMRRAGMHRDVRYGKYYVDFANDLNWMIEVDGAAYHMDVVADMDREIYIKNFLYSSPYGMRMLRVPAYRIINNPGRVHDDVLKFLQA